MKIDYLESSHEYQMTLDTREASRLIALASLSRELLGQNHEDVPFFDSFHELYMKTFDRRKEPSLEC